jgi:hypothetical protein
MPGSGVRLSNLSFPGWLGRKERKESLTPVLLVALVVGAFAIRIAAGMILGLDAPPTADDRDYDQLAVSLSEGAGYTIQGTFISFRPPLYPAFLSLVYRVAGRDYAAARIAQAGLAAITAWLTFLLGARVFGTFGAKSSIEVGSRASGARDLRGERRGFAAAALYAVAPADVFFSHGLLTETLFLPLLVAMAYCFVRAAEHAARGRMGLGWLLLGGALAGAATLTRPVLLLFPPFLLLWAWWTYARLGPDRASKSARAPTARETSGGKPREEGPGARPGAVFAALSAIILAALVVVTPWVRHVHEKTGYWVAVTTGGGATFWGANNIQVMDREHWGRWVPITRLPFYDELKVVAADQVAVDRRAWRLGLQFLENNPDKIPKLLLYKIARFWNPVANVRTSWKIIYFLTYGLAIPFMFAGMVMTFRRHEPVLILHLLVATFCLSALLFWGDARLRSGISPFLWLFAVVAFDAAVRRLRGGRESMEARG